MYTIGQLNNLFVKKRLCMKKKVF